MVLKILTFVVLSYVIALVMDIAVLLFGLPGFLWGFARMWGVTLSVFICLVLYEESIPASFRKFLGFSKRSIILYFLAPLAVYAFRNCVEFRKGLLGLLMLSLLGDASRCGFNVET